MVMTSGKGLCLSLFSCQPNQISTANRAYFPLAGFELAHVLSPLCSSQASGEGWQRLLGSNPNQDPQRCVDGVGSLLSPVSPTSVSSADAERSCCRSLCRGALPLAWPWWNGASVGPIPPSSLALGCTSPAWAPSSHAHSRADVFVLFHFPKPLQRLVSSSTFC